MRTSLLAALRRPALLIVGISLLAASLSTSGAEAVSNRSSQERLIRERAMDRIVHIEEGIVRDIPQMPRRCDSMTIQKVKIDIGGCNLYCEQEGEGVPLVLINGGPGGTHHCFHPHFSRAKHFARIIYYDQRGCGLSDYKPDQGYTVDQAVDDLDRLRRALHIDQWVVLGFSYGGLVAQCYATKYPEKLKGLVLVGSSMGLLDLSPSREREFISEQESQKIDQIERTPGLSTAQGLYNVHLNGDWKRQNYYRPSREDIARMVLFEWVHDAQFRSSILPSTNKVDLEGAFKDCPIPTLILEGKWDMSWSEDKPQRFHKNHPNARLVIFEQSAHSIFEDEPEAFFKELRRFLRHLPEISSDALLKWKEHLLRYETEKMEQLQKIPEGPMTEQERAATEEFHRIRARIEKGQKYQDASMPLRSLLSLISACANRNMDALRHVHVLNDPNERYNFDSNLREFLSLQIFRAPMPGEDAKDGDVWIIYTKDPNTSRLDDALLFILWKGNWMHWGNMGRPDAAVQWHQIADEYKKRLLPLLEEQ